MLAIDVQALRRVYKGHGKQKEVVGLDGISLQIGAGEIHGLLGPNGAGKTTLVKVLSTILLPSAGQVSILGHDVVQQPKKVRALIGILLGGDRGIYNKLSARQNLEYWAALYEVPYRESSKRVDTLLERVGLSAKADQKAEGYSRGMKQRLHLARALVGNAPVLFFDEPTMGMDPLAARDFRKLIAELKAEGKTILLATHDMAEAEAVCERVSLIDKGRLLAVETPQTLSRLLGQHEWVDFEASEETFQTLAAKLDSRFTTISRPNSQYRIEVEGAGEARQILQHLVGHGVTSIQTSRPSLEEVYVHIVGDRGLSV